MLFDDIPFKRNTTTFCLARACKKFSAAPQNFFQRSFEQVLHFGAFAKNFRKKILQTGSKPKTCDDLSKAGFVPARAKRHEAKIKRCQKFAKKLKNANCEVLPSFFALFSFKKALLLVAAALVLQTAAAAEKISFSLWAEVDLEPSIEYERKSDQPSFQYAAEKLRSIAATVQRAMMSGWNFGYTPLDLMRRVEENFDFDAVDAVSLNKIDFSKAKLQDGKLVCTAQFLADEGFDARRSMWQSSLYQKITAKGSAPFSDGVAGVETAYRDAVQSAVRERARSLLKNKPKRISGHAVLASPPKIAVRDGRYVVVATFYIRISEAKPWSVF